MDPKAIGEFVLRQQPAGAQSIVAHSKAVGVHDVLYTLRRESRAATSGPGRSAGTEPAVVEDVGDPVVEVMVEQLVDELDDLGGVFTFSQDAFGFTVVSVEVCPPRKRTWIFVVPAPGASQASRPRPRRRAFASAHGSASTGRTRARKSVVIATRRCADRLVDGDPILASTTLAFVSRLRQRAELLVPVPLERIGDESVGGIDHHEAALREIGVDLGSLDRATPKLIRFVVTRVRSPVEPRAQDRRRQASSSRPPVVRQLRRSAARDRLAVRLGPRIRGAIADVPGLELPSCSL